MHLTFLWFNSICRKCFKIAFFQRKCGLHIHNAEVNAK